MRRKDREKPKEFAYQVVSKCEYATLSMIDLQGNPYSVPITIANDDDYIYFHSAMQGTKTDILREHSKVCVVCVGDTYRKPDEFTTLYQSAIVKGSATEVTDDDTKVYALKLLCNRHTPTNMNDFDNAIKRSLSRTAIWKVSIDEITGKAKE